MPARLLVIPKHISKSIILLALLTGIWCSQLPGQQFEVINVSQISSATSARTHIDYTYRLTVRNTGGASTEVTAHVRSTSSETNVVDADLEFGDIPAGQVMSSRNAFTIRQKLATPLRLSVLSYVFRVGAGNAPPIADAGDDQIAKVGQVAKLDGSGSEDPNGSIVRYSWTYVGSIPAGLPASLSDPTDVSPAVYCFSAGTYIFHLVVTDDAGTASTWDEVRIRKGPVARAGSDQTVRLAVVQLDGSASFDPDGNSVRFSWRLSRPPGSNAQVSDPTAAQPTFVADVAASYRAELRVNSGGGASEPDAVEVTAIAAEAPVICGDLISGSIDAVGEVDKYRFAGEANRIVTLTLANTGGFAPGTAAVLRVLAPSGQVLLNYVGANVQRQLTLPAAGTYMIEVVGSNFTATGRYALGLECRNPAES